MTYHLIVQPFDGDFSFLEDIGSQANTIYKPKVKTFEVSPKIKLSDSVLTYKGEYFSKCLVENVVLKMDSLARKEIRKHYEVGEKMIYVEDILDEMTKHWAYNSNEILLGVLPYFVYGLTDAPNGQAERESHMAVISNFDIRTHNSEVSVGIGLHEIGHVLKLDHCEVEGCLMRRLGKFKDFYEGVYKLCEKHRNQIDKNWRDSGKDYK
jgi:predicted Zn-dependent protease